MNMSNHYRLQRWQLHGRLQRVRDQLRTLEQQLSHIDEQLQQLEPTTSRAPNTMMNRVPPSAAVVTVNRQQPGFPLPVAAG
jgi:hypothetical protein